MRDEEGDTVLHWVVNLSDIKFVKRILLLYPESERLSAVTMQNEKGNTVLHLATTVMHWMCRCDPRYFN